MWHVHHQKGGHTYAHHVPLAQHAQQVAQQHRVDQQAGAPRHNQPLRLHRAPSFSRSDQGHSINCHLSSLFSSVCCSFHIIFCVI